MQKTTPKNTVYFCSSGASLSDNERHAEERQHALYAHELPQEGLQVLTCEGPALDDDAQALGDEAEHLFHDYFALQRLRHKILLLRSKETFCHAGIKLRFSFPNK